MRFTPHLYFKGDWEAALRHYATCGLGEIKELRRYANTPVAERDGGAWREKVLHSVFAGPNLRLCASDRADSEPMKGCALLLEIDDPTEAAAQFARLSDGGRITVDFKLQFCGHHYGNFTDRYGVQWAIDCPAAG